MPQTYDITSGEISDITITAPTDVIDEAATQRVIEEEQAKIGPVYNTDANTTQQIVKRFPKILPHLKMPAALPRKFIAPTRKKKQQEVEQEITAAQQANAANPAQPTAVPTAYAVVPLRSEENGVGDASHRRQRQHPERPFARICYDGAALPDC